ncbi:MAG: right-handed parallel beta-helix repeat-containing protein, partial [Lentisphaeria bacterium]|nr:right-handed parallel beta-helix repeat-containing protein [Lentisphaeria bacterium]
MATGSLEISDSIFSGNTATGGGGGAIAVGGGTLKVSGSTFSGNTSAGGAISTGGVVYIENCVFDGNRSSGASGALNSGKYYISGTTFRNNVAGTHGGVIRLNSGGTIHLADVTVLNNSGTASFYIYGTSSAAAVYVEGLVTLGSGQSFRFDGNANDSRNQFQVVGSSFFTGHGVAKAVDASAGFSYWFINNANGVISASEGYKIFVLADSNNNDMYVTSADAMVTAAHSLVAVNNNPFTAYATLEAAQTAGVENILLFDYTPSGDIAVGTNTALIGGGVSGIGGTITVSNDAALTLAGDFTLTETLTVSGGTAALNNFTLSVASALFSGTDAYTLISGMAVPAADDLSVTVDGEARALNEWFDVGDHQYRLAVADDALGVQRRAYDTVYAVLNGATEIVLDGQTITFAGREDVFDSIAEAKTCLTAGGTLIVVGQTATTVTPGETATIMVESETNRDGDYDILTVEGQSSLSLRLVDSSMNGFTMIHGGSVGGDCSLELDNTELTSTDGRWYVLGSEVGGDLKVTMRDMTLTNPGKSYDALYLLRHTTAESGVVGGTIYFTLDNSEVTGTIYSGQWGANEQYCSGLVYTITDSAIGGDVFGAGGGGDIWVGGDVAMSLTDSTVGGDFVGSRKNTVTGTISMTLAGATVGGAVRKQKAGETVVTSALTLTLTGGTSVIGGLSEVDNLVIDAGARADFTTAQDLSDVAITVDGSAYAGSEIVVATGVSAIGGYTVTGAAGLTLYTAGEKMVLAEVSNTMSDGQTETNFVGGTSNLITGGTVTAAFFGTRNNSGSVRTVFTG